MAHNGAGGTITGYGAGKHRPGFGGAILIDDPIKPEDARSETIRQNVLDWFPSTLESRKNSPDTPIIIIMQRLHEEDLSGWLLNGGNGEEWDHVCLPALREDGTALWPDKHDADKLRQMQDAAPYSFAGQYQQRPAPLEGGLFKPDRIEIIDAIPALPITWLRGWDLASTTDGDWTAGAKLGKLPDGRFIIADMVRVRVGPDERDAMMLNTAKRDTFATRISIPQDPGQAGKTQIAYLTRQFTGFRVHSSPESGDKVTRAEPLAAQVNVGNVLMLRGSWNDALIDEMRMFPNGTFDDQIDGMSRAFSELIGKFTMNISPEVLLKASR
jgi:predicted phage terminase large subunit-like protein